jgi:hypothetical protein
MQENDPLNTETSVSAEVTPTGLKASARSRTISALDRLGGNFIDQFSTRIEAKTSRDRAKIGAEREIIEAATKHAVERLGKNPEFVDRMLADIIGTAVSQRENKDAVIQYAIEDLRNEPPTEDEANSGPETIAENTLNRIEFYAEGASTDEIRERFGKVLAAEIRRPGTFAAKTLRIVDELDSHTAAFFERFAASGFQNVVPVCQVAKPTLGEQIMLMEADLLVDPGTGKISLFREAESEVGTESWLLEMGDYALNIPRDKVSTLPTSPVIGNPLIIHKGQPALPVYILTSGGTAISSIIKRDRLKNASEILAKVIEKHPDIEISLLAKNAQGNWDFIQPLSED